MRVRDQGVGGSNPLSPTNLFLLPLGFVESQVSKTAKPGAPGGSTVQGIRRTENQGGHWL